MMMRNERQPSPVRLVPMCGLLGLLLLCAAELTGFFALLFFLPIALSMLPLCEERLYGYAILCDVLIAAVVLFLSVPHYAWLAFVCVLAPYVPLRHAMRDLKDKRLATLLPVGIAVLWTAFVVFVLHVLGIELITQFSPLITVLIGLGVLLFLFLLDAAYQLLLKAYRKHIRRFLLPRA